MRECVCSVLDSVKAVSSVQLSAFQHVQPTWRTCCTVINFTLLHLVSPCLLTNVLQGWESGR